jgi:hypothetical protein
VRDILTAEQLGRLRQIGVQSQGLRAFNEPEVAAALKLTAAQRERIRALEADTFFGGLAGKPAGGSPDDFREAQDRRLRAARDRVVAEVLTPEQARRWRDLVGKPFEGPLMPFGLPGPPGSPGPPP